MANLYEIYSGEELKIAEKIQQRRYQMLVHSYIYYELNENIVSDSKWSEWATELAQLQYDFPEIAKQVPYAKDFANWDGSSGAFLDYKYKPNIIATAERLLHIHNNKTKKTVTAPIPLIKPLPAKKITTAKKKLF